MRNISFFLTTMQVENRTKTVTRRLGWQTLKPGDLLQACEKCQGIPKGGKIRRLAVIRVVSVRREQLCQILGDEDEPTREGFPDLTSAEFEEMFCRHTKCHYTDEITRIEFEYVTP